VWQQIVNESAPEPDRAVVLCHNDMNPTNIMYDGARLLLFDWQTTALNDPYYDLGTLAMFLRMDEAAMRQLLSAYDNAAVTVVPPRLKYFRRVSAVLSGSAFLNGARLRGYRLSEDELVIDDTPTLGDIYAELRTGRLNLGLPEAQWRFGLALLRESTQSC
ncbi:MAG: phosphotransferase, partial [Gemmatimonadaceae bacterium]